MPAGKKYLLIGIAAIILPALAAAAGDQTLRLARELADEGDHAAAAVEFRRLALAAENPAGRGGFAWAAAHEYGRAGAWPATDKMLNFAENADPGLELPALLLRGQSAAAQNNPAEADFYFQAARDNPAAPDDLRRYAARHSAALLAGLRQLEAAQSALADAPGENSAGQRALAEYAGGRDKKPLWGGILGVIPGLGYAYAGEYANAARSLILNSLFIFGMVNTADHDEWGAFAVIAFFEFTWYSGSIYGGLDAVHRHNRQRLEDCQEQIIGGAACKPDWQSLPLLSLQFEF